MSRLEQSGRPVGARPARARPMLLAALIVAAGALLFVLANTHLVYVAITSQPECVAHLKAGETTSGTGVFSAAKPAC